MRVLWAPALKPCAAKVKIRGGKEGGGERARFLCTKNELRASSSSARMCVTGTYPHGRGPRAKQAAKQTSASVEGTKNVTFCSLFFMKKQKRDKKENKCLSLSSLYL